MECVRKLVYAENTDKLEAMYQRLKEDAAIRKYANLKKHLEGYWSAEVNGLYVSEIKPCSEETIMQSLALGY